MRDPSLQVRHTTTLEVQAAELRFRAAALRRAAPHCGAQDSAVHFAVTWDELTGQPENLFFFCGPGRPKAISIDLQPGEGELLAAVLTRKGEGA